MIINDLLEQDHDLNPSEKYIIIECWIEESKKRLELYDNSKLETLSIEEVFGDVKH